MGDLTGIDKFKMTKPIESNLHKMKRPFWVKGTTPWDTFRINLNLVFHSIGDIAVEFLYVLCLFGILYILFYKIPKEIMAIDMKASATKAKRKAEQNECLKMEYAGNKFYKFNLEGHEYWYIKEFENNVGFCHSESCPCKTNNLMRLYQAISTK